MGGLQYIHIYNVTYSKMEHTHWFLYSQFSSLVAKRQSGNPETPGCDLSSAKNSLGGFRFVKKVIYVGT